MLMHLLEKLKANRRRKHLDHVGDFKHAKNVRLSMRRILVFSDLHANYRALENIIPVLKNVDLSIFCGDILGYGKDIGSCIDFVLNNIDLIVIGNHERLAVSEEDIGSQIPAVQKSTLFTRRKRGSSPVSSPSVSLFILS